MKLEKLEKQIVSYLLLHEFPIVKKYPYRVGNDSYEFQA